MPPFSGTVGGTTAGLAGGIPSIAFSSDGPDVPEDDPAFAAHFENVADFAVELIALLETKPGALSNEPGLLPPGIALNVNYPTVDPDDVAGVKLTVQGQASSASLVFIDIGDDIFIPSLGPGEGGDDVQDSDTEALAAGFITVTPVDPGTPGDGGEEISNFGTQQISGALTARMTVDVPANAISLTLEALGSPGSTFGLGELIGPGGKVYENTQLTGAYIWVPGAEAFSTTVPNTDRVNVQLVPGGGASCIRHVRQAVSPGTIVIV